MDARVLKESDIELKDDISEKERTEARDATAFWILKNVVRAGRWPMDIKAIAEEEGHSRQHIKNTLDSYFEPVNAASNPTGKVGSIELVGKEASAESAIKEIDVPADVDETSYYRGFIAGYLRATEHSVRR